MKIVIDNNKYSWKYLTITPNIPPRVLYEALKMRFHMSVIIITRCFFLLLRRKQHHKTRNFGGMSIRKRISRLIVDKEKTGLPTDPPSLKDAPHIDSLFKRVTMGAGHKEDAYLVLRTNYQQIKNSHYETKKGKVECVHLVYIIYSILSL